LVSVSARNVKALARQQFCPPLSCSTPVLAACPQYIHFCLAPRPRRAEHAGDRCGHRYLPRARRQPALPAHARRFRPSPFHGCHVAHIACPPPITGSCWPPSHQRGARRPSCVFRFGSFAAPLGAHWHARANARHSGRRMPGAARTRIPGFGNFSVMNGSLPYFPRHARPR
jgi:hypothetical protein